MNWKTIVELIQKLYFQIDYLNMAATHPRLNKEVSCLIVSVCFT